MKKSLWIAAAVVAMSGGAALAEGLPSQAKLAKLGLSGMQVASDEAGAEVRGKFFGSGSFLFQNLVQDPNVTTNQAASGGINGFTFGQAPRTLGAAVTAEGGTLQEVTVNSTETTTTTSNNNGTVVTTTNTVTSSGLMRVNNPFVSQVTNSLTGGTYTGYSSGGMFFRGN